MPQQFGNNFTTQVAVQFEAVHSTLNITTGHGAILETKLGSALSAANYCLLTLVRISGGVETAWEIVRVTARATDALTVTRAQEGTTAIQWLVGEKVELRWTKGSASTLNVLSAKYEGESAAQVFTAGGTITIAHGLGVAPLMYQIFIKCTTAENGFLVGDILLLGGGFTEVDSGGTGIMATRDATNINLRIGVAGIHIIRKSDAQSVIITPANWTVFANAIV